MHGNLLTKRTLWPQVTVVPMVNVLNPQRTYMLMYQRGKQQRSWAEETAAHFADALAKSPGLRAGECPWHGSPASVPNKGMLLQAVAAVPLPRAGAQPTCPRPAWPPCRRPPHQQWQQERRCRPPPPARSGPRARCQR